MKVEAKLQIKLEQVVYVCDRYRTLFYGLKRNHPHSAAIVYPLTFLIHRIVYSAIVLFMAGLPMIGAYLMSIICILTIAYVIVEQQWEDSLIGRQQVFNEIALYLILVIATVCALPLAPAALSPIGWTLILIVLTTVVVNLVIIAYFTFPFLIRYLKRNRNKLACKKQMKIVHLTPDSAK